MRRPVSPVMPMIASRIRSKLSRAPGNAHWELSTARPGIRNCDMRAAGSLDAYRHDPIGAPKNSTMCCASQHGRSL
jgi:hypothetical protein